MSPQKVYVIEVPDQSATRKRRAGMAGWPTIHRRRRETHSTPCAKSKSWLVAFRAYILGPASLLLWPPENGRTASVILGVGSLVGAALLSIWWRAFFDVLQPLTFRAVIWAAAVAVVILTTGTAWARAVAMSEEAVRWPKRFRRPSTVCVLGLVFPGLGLLIAGRRWKAAFAMWCAGLLVAAVVVVKHWRWLVADGVQGGGGPTHQTIEGVLGVAAGCMVFGFLAWLVMAFDGVRAVSPAARSGAVADGLALALLVTLAIFLATFRPVPIARDLKSAAEGLRNQGLRVIPLALYEVASTLDSGTPDYLAGAATLYDELGLSETAIAKRELLQNRAAQFAGAVGAELVPDVTREASLPWANEPLDTIDHTPPNDLR